MRNRVFLGMLLLAGLLFPLASCTNDPSLTSIVITPSSATVQLAPQGAVQGHTQFTAVGYYTHPGHTATTKDITSEVVWSSSDTQVATVANGNTNAGLVTVTGFVNGEAWYGNTNITASAQGFHGDVVSNSVTFTVTAASSSSSTDVTSITVTPNPFTFTTLGATQTFVATGTTSSGTSGALTGLSGLVWSSGNTSYVTVDASTGVATAVAAGSTTITATYTNSDNTTAKGSTTVTVQ